MHLACSLARAMLVHAACRERRLAERALWIRGHFLRKQGAMLSRPARCAECTRSGRARATRVGISKCPEILFYESWPSRSHAAHLSVASPRLVRKITIRCVRSSRCASLVDVVSRPSLLCVCRVGTPSDSAENIIISPKNEPHIIVSNRATGRLLAFTPPNACANHSRI